MSHSPVIYVAANMQPEALADFERQGPFEPALGKVEYGCPFGCFQRPGILGERLSLAHKLVSYRLTRRPASPARRHQLGRHVTGQYFLDARQRGREHDSRINLEVAGLGSAKCQRIIAHGSSPALGNRTADFKPITVSGGRPVIAAILASMAASWRLYSTRALSRRGSAGSTSLRTWRQKRQNLRRMFSSARGVSVI